MQDGRQGWASCSIDRAHNARQQAVEEQLISALPKSQSHKVQRLHTLLHCCRLSQAQACRSVCSTVFALCKDTACTALAHHCMPVAMQNSPESCTTPIFTQAQSQMCTAWWRRDTQSLCSHACPPSWCITTTRHTHMQKSTQPTPALLCACKGPLADAVLEDNAVQLWHIQLVALGA